MLNRQIKNILKRGLFNIYKIAERVGVHVLPVHYYSALPSIHELKRTQEVWAYKSELPGLNWNIDQQIRNLRTICKPYFHEYEGNRNYLYAVDHAFGPGFGYIEAQALHAVIRQYKPRRIIEVGSGVSTWCMLNALQQNKQEHDVEFNLTCIEPYPSGRLSELDDIVLHRKKVQEVPFSPLFSELQANDILFIDSSHTVKTGSDVNYLILEILPRLNPGVIVHFHDIYLPYDYSRNIFNTFLHWSETSLLRAFLIHNHKTEIIFCLSYLHYESKETLSEVFPEYRSEKDHNGIRDPQYKPFEYFENEHFPASIFFKIL